MLLLFPLPHKSNSGVTVLFTEMLPQTRMEMLSCIFVLEPQSLPKALCLATDMNKGSQAQVECYVLILLLTPPPIFLSHARIQSHAALLGAGAIIGI